MRVCVVGGVREEESASEGESREWQWREGEVWRDRVGDGTKEGGASWGMGERHMTMCCWSQGVTMVIGERPNEMGARERDWRHTLVMQIDILLTD